jgi:hypothetical protein
MKERYNCPNCGAPIESTRCPYCGTVFYDFATVNVGEPTYIRLKASDRILTFKAFVGEVQITHSIDELPTANVEFVLLPDDGVILSERRTDE